MIRGVSVLINRVIYKVYFYAHFFAKKGQFKAI